jgi:hypothetical protein
MIHWLRIVAFLVTGAIFGPLLWAAVAALMPEPQYRLPAYGLLREFDSRDRTIVSDSMDLFGEVRDCGYDADALFTKSDQEHYPVGQWQWTPHAGYMALTFLRRSNWRDRLNDLRTRRLEATTSNFSARFLRECMRSTLFGSLCERRTRTLLGEWKSPYRGPASAGNQLDDPGEREMICVYLDGVAVRRGVPLAKR